MKSVQIYFPLAVILYACFSVVTIVDQANAAFARAMAGIKCIDSYEPGKMACDDGNCNFDEPNHVFRLACNTDCKAQHGATHGYCLSTDICNCGPPVYSKIPMPLQCINISQAELYQTICEDDCKCTHNKIGGGCNFWTKACECGPTNLKPELDCPYPTARDYFRVLIQRYHSLGFDVKQILSTRETQDDQISF